MTSLNLRRPRVLIAIASIALVAGSTSYAGTAHAAGTGAASALFVADVASVGPIPDGSGARDVTIPVSGLTTPSATSRSASGPPTAS